MTTQLIDSATRSAANAFRRKLDHQFRVKQTLLFGSRARRDNHHESDADLAVLLKGEPGKFIDTKLAMDDLAYEVLLDSGTGFIILGSTCWRLEGMA